MRASEVGASTAPPCYAACNAPASRKEWRIASALHVSPRHSYCRRRLSRGGKPPVKVWLGGSTPNEITSCQGTPRSGCALFRLRKRFHRARGRLIKRLWSDALIWMRFTPPKILSAGAPCAKAPLANEGIALVSRGVKMSELCDSSAGTRNKASVSAFSRREEEHTT